MMIETPGRKICAGGAKTSEARAFNGQVPNISALTLGRRRILSHHGATSSIKHERYKNFV